MKTIYFDYKNINMRFILSKRFRSLQTSVDVLRPRRRDFSLLFISFFFSILQEINANRIPILISRMISCVRVEARHKRHPFYENHSFRSNAVIVLALGCEIFHENC